MSKKRVEDGPNFVAFSEYLNFNVSNSHMLFILFFDEVFKDYQSDSQKNLTPLWVSLKLKPRKYRKRVLFSQRGIEIIL